jgi:Putative Flp pilus-assembly TadE/G-like
MTTRKTSGGSGERGAVLIQVAVALLALLALSAFVFDYGVMWSSRAQAQNAADAGALSGAISLAFDDPDDFDGARAKALAVARANNVWGEVPDVTAADVTFPACPPTPGMPEDTCVKVDVFRNQRAGGNPLPTFFARLVGITEQGVRATATARVLVGDSAQCVKPWAIPDKWNDLLDNPQDGQWTPDDAFERYVQNGQNAGAVLSPADVYFPPGVTGHTGFTVEADYGTALTLKHGNPQQAIRPGYFFPVVINPLEGPGANNYGDNIATCDPTVVGPGDLLTVEPGNMVGPTNSGVAALVAQDSAATWSPTASNGRGGPVGGCMAAGTCAVSPRLVALAVFDPDIYDAARAGGRTEVVVTKILGFWIQGMQANGDVLGYLTHYPALAEGGSGADPDSAFLTTVVLVR